MIIKIETEKPIVLKKGLIHKIKREKIEKVSKEKVFKIIKNIHGGMNGSNN